MTAGGGNWWDEVTANPILSLTGIQFCAYAPAGRSRPDAPLAGEATVISYEDKEGHWRKVYQQVPIHFREQMSLEAVIDEFVK
jgi:hypothetical protein